MRRREGGGGIPTTACLFHSRSTLRTARPSARPQKSGHSPPIFGHFDPNSWPAPMIQLPFPPQARGCGRRRVMMRLSSSVASSPHTSWPPTMKMIRFYGRRTRCAPVMSFLFATVSVISHQTGQTKQPPQVIENTWQAGAAWLGITLA